MATQDYFRRIGLSGKLIRLVLLALFGGASLFVFINVNKLDHRIENIQTAEHQAPLWVASQLQFEFLRFHAALGSFALGETRAEDVDLRFNIAWSRITVMQEGRLPLAFQDFGLNPVVVTELEEVFTRLAPVIASLGEIAATDQRRQDVVREIFQQIDGFDLAIKDFLVSLAQAQSRSRSAFRTDLLSLSNSVTFLGIAVICSLALFVVILLQDVRNTRSVALDMRRMAEEASTVARMKINFMSVVSHELRTPLTAILGGLALLKLRLGEKLATDETSLKLVDVASRNGDRLLELVNNILDAQALSEGKVRAVLDLTDVNAVTRTAVEDCHAYGIQFGITYAVDTPAQKMMTLTDRARLTQVLVNLISNATKFSSSGDTVRIAVRQVDSKSVSKSRIRGSAFPPTGERLSFRRFTRSIRERPALPKAAAWV